MMITQLDTLQLIIPNTKLKFKICKGIYDLEMLETFS